MILSFLLAVVTIVSIATFRMQPFTYSGANRNRQGEFQYLPFQGADPYDSVTTWTMTLKPNRWILDQRTLALRRSATAG